MNKIHKTGIKVLESYALHVYIWIAPYMFDKMLKC